MKINFFFLPFLRSRLVLKSSPSRLRNPKFSKRGANNWQNTKKREQGGGKKRTTRNPDRENSSPYLKRKIRIFYGFRVRCSEAFRGHINENEASRMICEQYRSLLPFPWPPLHPSIPFPFLPSPIYNLHSSPIFQITWKVLNSFRVRKLRNEIFFLNKFVGQDNENRKKKPNDYRKRKKKENWKVDDLPLKENNLTGIFSVNFFFFKKGVKT